MRTLFILFILLIGLLGAASALADEARLSLQPPEDPLDSSQWQTMHTLYLQEHPVVIDESIKILAPSSAEDSLAVPVMIDASAIENVQKIIVFADFNPLPKVLEYYPKQAAPRIGFRFKIQQASPLRAAVLDSENIWHVNGVWIDAAGGGCTLPSVGSGSEEWISRLGEINARLWSRDDGSRLKFSVVHPMDTGLADGIPAFYVESVDIKDVTGRELATLRAFEPVSENPLFTLDLPGRLPLLLSGRDNNGNRFGAEITP
jgi:sulfur-oxidizing protein SoxY